MTPAEMQARIAALEGFCRDILSNSAPQWITEGAAGLMGVSLDEAREPEE